MSILFRANTEPGQNFEFSLKLSGGDSELHSDIQANSSLKFPSLIFRCARAEPEEFDLRGTTRLSGILTIR